MTAPARPLPWLLSAPSDSILRREARNLCDWAESQPELDPLGVGHSLAAEHAGGEQRAVIFGTGREELLEGLAALAEGRSAANLVSGRAGADNAVTFVFPGQGPQWVGMALDLIDSSEVFRERMSACDAALSPHAEWSLLDALRAGAEESSWQEVEVVQTALFAVMVSLFDVWRSFGVEPKAVVGQSIGEAAAACAAGALSLEDAAELSLRWARAQVSIPRPGAIASVAMNVDDLRARISGREGEVELAGINGPHSCAVAGDVEAVRELLVQLQADGIGGREIDTAIRAVHSSHAEAVRDRVVRELASIPARSTELPFYSGVFGERLDTAQLDSVYWATNICRPVLFEKAVRAALDDGQRVFVELSPHPVLTMAVQETGEDLGATAVGSLRRGQGGLDRLFVSLAEAHVRGVDVDWTVAFKGSQAQRIELPALDSASDADPSAATDDGGPASLRSRLLGLSEAEAETIALGLVKTELATLLGLPGPDSLDATQPFRELGLDSAVATELRNRLSQTCGLKLPAAVAFDYPSAEELARYLRGKALGTPTAPASGPSSRPSLDEPIAIVGLGCRFPGGVTTPEELWQLLATGTDAITEFPADRGWDVERIYDPDPDRPGKSYTREGGFLTDIAGFDAGFFAVSPREALAMDPQQRLLLECAWEALEDTGIDPATLRGSPTGVFAGISSQDYGPGLRPASGDPRSDEVAIHRLAGTLTSVISGRVSYALGLEGPAMTIDTACSSSLVAMHLAGQALRGGECDLALAGGVTIMATAGAFIEFSRQRALSPDGRCKSFGAGADGTGWSEGSGLLLLERLSDAEAAGHRIHAVIRGSAINQDGASNGLTAPNGPSQERVIRQALASAHLSPAEVDAVDAHGTGTTLGDPIEAEALLATYGQERDSGPLALGSLKSNIGHTLGAAGVGGVIKMVMALREEELPRTLHVEEPTPHVDWEAGEVELLTEAKPWPKGERPRRAGVSSFGISGTNAHLIIEEPPQAAPATGSEVERMAPPAIPWALSAKTPEALAETAQRLGAHVAAKDPDPLDVAHTLLKARASFPHRAVVVGADQAELLAGLDALAKGDPNPGLSQGKASTAKTAFLLSGQGSQRAEMGKELYEAFPLYAESFDAACEALESELGISVKQAVFAPADSELSQTLDRTDLTQASTFALQVALFDLLSSFGLRPDYLIGHSIGEISAAHLAGVLSLSDAAKLVASRGALMAALPSGGAMAAVKAGEAEAKESLADFEGKLTIAAINGPASTVVSGDEDALQQWQELQEEQGVKTKRLRVSHAFHSHRMEPMLKEFEEVAATLDFQPPQIPILSNLSAELLTTEQATSPAYWAAHIREPVRFAEGIARLEAEGVSRFLELGPDATLTAMGAESLTDPEALLVSALRRGRPEPQSFVSLLGAAHAGGLSIDWDSLFKDSGAVAVKLPTYPFQKERYWLAPVAGSGDASSLGQSGADHPLLGASIALASESSYLFTGRLSLTTHPWLADHAIAGTPILPGTAFAELALRAGAEVGAGRLQELVLEAPLPIPESGAVQLQLTLAPSDGEEEGVYEVAIYSRPEESEEEDEGEDLPWSRHAGGILDDQEPDALGFEATAWPPPGAEPIETEDFYDLAAEIGLEYGPAFQGLGAAWRQGEDLYAEISLASEQASEAGRFGIHPALLDAALHPALLDTDPAKGLRLPFSFGGLALHPHHGTQALRIRFQTDDESISLEAADQDGLPVLSLASLSSRVVDPAALRIKAKEPDSLFSIEWAEVELGEAPDAELEIHREPTELFRAFDAQGEAGGSTDLFLYAPQHPEQANPAVGTQALNVEALELVQAFLADERLAESRLAILTRGAMALDPSESPYLPTASLWGLIRSAQTEHPGRLLLVDTDGSKASEEALPAALGIADEPQLALREGVARAPRLAGAGAGELRAPGEGPWCLEAGDGGTLEGLSLAPAPQASRPLEPGEVRVSVRAAGLNFRDVLIALGVYPGKAAIGGEGAGVVLEVGAGVEGLSPGDRVFGLLPAFGPIAISERSFLAPLPEDWSFSEGASVPIVFATAYYGLIDLAGLKRGERVLIHAGAGGVGMAAIQIAHHLGAEVFATASPAKWGALRALGLDSDHIASSRDLEFKQKFLEKTGGAGLDVVLDSLAREFVDASLDLLPNGGRFIEMGKADVREPDEIAVTHPGVSYRAFDLVEAGPERSAEILAELLSLFDQGVLKHAPIATWDIRRAPEAFRFLSQARHIGKLVLTMPQGIDPEGTVLITGGLSGIGALAARHLANAHGVKHMLLASRRGEEAPGAKELTSELAELGCEAEAHACDVTDRKALEGLLAKVPKEHPLTAVVHCAGVLDDALIADQSPERLATVMGPKAKAAWNLHELTRNTDLDCFVLYSSAAASLGSPGQSNYAAANSFLDALAQRRRAEGLAATSIAWGLWEQESELTGELGEADRARLSRSGLIPLSAEAGLSLFDRAHAGAEAIAVAAPLDATALRQLSRAAGLPALLSGLVGTSRRRPKAAAGSLARRLAGVPEGEREAIVLALVREQVATVLGHSSAEAIDPVANFKDLGFDSLGAVELRNRLGQVTGMRLKTTLVFDHPSSAEASAYLLSQVEGDSNVQLPVYQELDKLEATLTKVELDEAEKERLLARVRSFNNRLLQLWGSEAGSGNGSEGEAAAMNLESASDDELFELIDKELGS